MNIIERSRSADKAFFSNDPKIAIAESKLHQKAESTIEKIKPYLRKAVELTEAIHKHKDSKEKLEFCLNIFKFFYAITDAWFDFPEEVDDIVLNLLPGLIAGIVELNHATGKFIKAVETK